MDYVDIFHLIVAEFFHINLISTSKLSSDNLNIPLFNLEAIMFAFSFSFKCCVRQEKRYAFKEN